MSGLAEFTTFVRNHAVKAGYDIDSPRGGGKKALAEDTGMSPASVSRMLSGLVIPDAAVFESVAEAIDVPVGYLFELAGIVSPGVLTAGRTPPEAHALTPVAAATRLGVRGKRDVALFELFVEAIRAGGS